MKNITTDLKLLALAALLFTVLNWPNAASAETRTTEPRIMYAADALMTSESGICRGCFSTVDAAFAAYKAYLSTQIDPPTGFAHWRAVSHHQNPETYYVNGIAASHIILDQSYDEQSKTWRPPAPHSSISIWISCLEGQRQDSIEIDAHHVKISCEEIVPEESHCDACEGAKAPPGFPLPGISQSHGNPIFIATKLKQQIEVDYQSARAGGLRFVRTYRSDLNGWSHNYQSMGIDLATSSLGEGDATSWPEGGCRWGIASRPPLTLHCARPMATGQKNDFVVRRSNGRMLSFGNAANLLPNANINDRVTPIIENGVKSGYSVYYAAVDATEIYDLSGRIKSYKARTGQKILYTYSDTTTPVEVAAVPGLLIAVTDAFSEKLRFTYDAQSRMKSMIDPAGNEYLYAYDEGSASAQPEAVPPGNLTSVTYPGGDKRIYWYGEPDNLQGYNGPKKLTGITDENGKRFATFKYDRYGAVISTEHAGGVGRYAIDGYDTGMTDPLGTERRYRFTTVLGIKQVTSESQPSASGSNSAERSVTLDANGNVATSTDFNGILTKFSYDMARNLETGRTEAEGTVNARTVSTQWHTDFRIATKIAEPGRLTTFTHDASGNILTKVVQATTDTDGSKAFTATRVGSPRKWTFTYNTAGQVLTETGPRTDVADVTTYTYDERGNLASVKNAAKQSTTFGSYDANGRVGTITDANNIVTTLTYWPRGWLKSRSVSAGNAVETTSYDYDGVGQLKTVTMPDKSSVSYSYDDAHRLTGIADSLGNSITYTLDNMGNRLSEEVNDSGNALKRKTTRVIDALNRVQQITGAQ